MDLKIYLMDQLSLQQHIKGCLIICAGFQATQNIVLYFTQLMQKNFYYLRNYVQVLYWLIKTIITKKAEEKNVNLLFPVDTVCGKEFSNETEIKNVNSKEIPDGWQGLDIGPESVKLFTEELQKAKTVMWNGPLGVFEFENFAKGTDAIAKVLSEIDATTIIGGGDSAAAVEKGGYADKMTHISTGGGASLEFLEGKALPGITCLQDN